MAEPVQIGVAVALLGAASGLVGGFLKDLVAPAIADRRAARHRAADKQAKAADLISRYRDPLLRSAIDLQSRLTHIVSGKFLTIINDPIESQRQYALNSTLYVIAEYLGWVEVIRQRLQFLDLGGVEQTREFNRLLGEVGNAMGSSQHPDRLFQIFRTDQRAIGELMIDDSLHGQDQRRCTGYATFSRRLGDEPTFYIWFESLQGRLQRAAQLPELRFYRLVAIQHALIDLIAFLAAATVTGIETDELTKVSTNEAGHLIQIAVCVSEDLYSYDPQAVAADRTKLATLIDDALLGDPVSAASADFDRNLPERIIDRRCLSLSLPNHRFELDRLVSVLMGAVHEAGLNYLLVTVGTSQFVVMAEHQPEVKKHLSKGLEGGSIAEFSSWLNRICQPSD